MIKELNKHKQNLPKELSKLFNIVANFYGLNNPKKVGYCSIIYTEYFKKNKDSSISDAVKFYLKDRRPIIINNMSLMSKFSIELISYLSSEESIKSLYFAFNNRDLKKEKNTDILVKIALIFQDERIPNHQKMKNIKNWIKEILKYSTEYINKESKLYLYNLLTIESMRGTIIQNEILNKFEKHFPNKVIESTESEELSGIDAYINGKIASIKSINYKHSPYKRAARVNLEKLINGPIIYYKLTNDSYEIIDFNQLLEFYSDPQHH